MLYPSIQTMTDERVNRYMLVIAAAKGARYVTCRNNEERDFGDSRRSELDRNVFLENDQDKAVSIAISRLHGGKFKIVQ